MKFSPIITLIRNIMSSGILPALALGAASSDSQPELRKWIISPNYHPYRWWQKFLVVSVFYSACVSPLEFAFAQVDEGVFFVVDNIVNGFFAVDILITFFVAYLDEATDTLVEDPEKIGLRYVSRWFIFDVASTTPFGLIFVIFTGQQGSSLAFSFLNMLRLLRLRRLSATFSRLEKDIRFSYFWIRCIKLICVSCFKFWGSTGYAIYCTLCCMLLLLSGSSLSTENEDMDRCYDSKF